MLPILKLSYRYFAVNCSLFDVRQSFCSALFSYNMERCPTPFSTVVSKNWHMSWSNILIKYEEEDEWAGNLRNRSSSFNIICMPWFGMLRSIQPILAFSSYQWRRNFIWRFNHFYDGWNYVLHRWKKPSFSIVINWYGIDRTELLDSGIRSFCLGVGCLNRIPALSTHSFAFTTGHIWETYPIPPCHSKLFFLVDDWIDTIGETMDLDS